MYYLKIENARKMIEKYMYKVRDHEGNTCTTLHPQVTGVQWGVTKLKVLYVCLTVPNYEWCPTFLMKVIN